MRRFSGRDGIVVRGKRVKEREGEMGKEERWGNEGGAIAEGKRQKS